MDFATLLKIVFGTIGGLGLFLLGMKQMSEGMQAVAGERLRKLIGAVTDNRLIACGVGASITSLIQSSSVTTVLIVGMVNAGLMTLRQSIGVILGADIGTTITAWIIALKIAEYGLIILGTSAFFYLFSKNDRVRYIAMLLVGLGMVFFGLQLMKEGMLPLRDNAEFLALLSRFKPVTYGGVIKCVLVGAFVTAIIQSSSATVAITITMAMTGTIQYETAVALVLGENIGTTITAFLASLGTTTNARRAAFAHISIKVFGVMIMLPFFYIYIWLLKSVLSENMSIAARIAFAHSLFNIIIICIFLPFIHVISRFVTFLVPGKSHEEKPHLTYLDVRIFDAPAMGVKQSYDEIIRMSRGVLEMLEWLRNSLEDPSEDKERQKKIFDREKLYDTVQKEIVEFISKLLTGNLPHAVTTEARKQLRMADEYESISDYIVNILKLCLRLKRDNLYISIEGKKELLDLHDMTSSYLKLINQAVEEQNLEILPKALSRGDAITHKVKDVRSSHLLRLSANQTSPMKSLIYMDMLSSYRRIKDHSLNIAEVVAGEK